jgi:hypothetical protein
VLTLIYRRLDKLRLIETYPKKPSKSEYSKCLNHAMTFVESGEFKRITTKYHTIFLKEFLDCDEKSTFRLAFGPSKYGSTISIDFVPRLLTDKGWADVGGYLRVIFGKGVVWNKFRIQVMEFAMDVKQPMSNFIFLAEGLPSFHIEQGTIYLGAKYGKRTYCIYDKQKQLKAKKGKIIAYPLTRIEARRRCMQVTLSALKSVPSPFTGLIVVPKSKLAEMKAVHPKDPVLESFISSVAKGLTGHAVYWKQDGEKRKHLLKTLKPNSLQLGVPGKNWDDWIGRTLDKLAKKFEGF